MWGCIHGSATLRGPTKEEGSGNSDDRRSHSLAKRSRNLSGVEVPHYGQCTARGALRLTRGPAPRNLVTVDNTSHLQRNSLFKYTCIRYRSTGNRAHTKNTQSRHSEPYNLQSTSWDADRDGQSTRDGDRGERATTCRVEVAARRQHASGPEATAPRLPERKHAVG